MVTGKQLTKTIKIPRLTTEMARKFSSINKTVTETMKHMEQCLFKMIVLSYKMVTLVDILATLLFYFHWVEVGKRMNVGEDIHLYACYRIISM